MSIRIALSIVALFAIAGLMLFIWGWVDYADSSTASAEPAVFDLADLEKGTKKVENNHVRIGPHIALWGFYEYTGKKPRFGEKAEKAKEDTKVDAYFYPIVSNSNPASQKIRDLEKQYGSLDKIPDDVHIETPKEIAVVVKTYRYSKVSDLPTALLSEQQVQGLIVNRTTTLSSKDKALLKKNLPGANFDKVLVLEAGRTPSSNAWCYARMGFGVMVALLGVGVAGVGMVIGRRREPGPK